MTASILKTEPAVCLTPRSLFERRGPAAADFRWKPLDGRGIRWRTSAVCRASEWDAPRRLAVSAVLHALQAHDDWQPSRS